MVGLGEAYLPAFALAAGMGQVSSGLVATVPMLFGAILQLAAPWLVRRVRSHRRWVVSCVVCQGLSLLILPLVSVHQSAVGWVIYAAATLYWAAGLSTGPAWNTWIESLVPRRLRTQYFGRRGRISYAAVLGGFLAGGVALQMGHARGAELSAFFFLFVAAAFARFASARFLSRQSEPYEGRITDRRVGWSELVSQVAGQPSGRLLAYLLAAQVAVQISGPYFVPFMLRELNVSYLQLSALVATVFVGKFALLPVWGWLVKRIGPRRLLVWSALAIVPMSSCWLLCQRVPYLLGLQFVAGGMWSAYELATQLMFIEAIPTEKRTSLLTVYNVGNAAAMAVGTIIGAAVLTVCPIRFVGYLSIFWLSGVGRLLALTLLTRVDEPPAEDPQSIAEHNVTIDLNESAARPAQRLYEAA